MKIISLDVTYGYEIVTRLQQFGFKDVKEGTIYPILVRLEKKGMIRSEYRRSSLGPDRKYYMMTEEGRLLLLDFISVWKQVTDSVDSIIRLEEHHDTE